MKTEIRYIVQNGSNGNLDSERDDGADAMLLKALRESERRLINFRPDAWGAEGSEEQHAWNCVTRELRFTEDDWRVVSDYIDALCSTATQRISHDDYPAPARVAVEEAIQAMREAKENFTTAMSRAGRVGITI